ncbi:hypothetical protein ACFXKR_08530 [Streptomyces violascens]|uniref:hypothetical protein n=1 Tax=Streptomyces violascens TaxID=67381 RepID=UPI0036A87D3B
MDGVDGERGGKFGELDQLPAVAGVAAGRARAVLAQPEQRRGGECVHEVVYEPEPAITCAEAAAGTPPGRSAGRAGKIT